MYRAIVTVLLVLGCVLAARPIAAPALEPGDVAGPIKLLNSAGLEIKLENYNERPATAVLFLSSRCAATEKSIVDINTLYQKHRRKEVLYVGVCSNDVESADELRDFAHKRGMIFSTFRDPAAREAKRLGAKATPEVFLLDRAGKIVFHSGLESHDELESFDDAVRNVMQGEPVTAAPSTSKRTPIGKPGPQIDRDDTHGTISFSSELIFEKIPRAAAFHCSTIAEATNGDLLCLWYGGSYESANDQVLFLSRRKAGERDWSEPQVLIEDSRQPPGNGLILVDGRKRVWVVWCRMESTQPIRRGGGWDKCRLMYRTSADNGNSWTQDKPMLADDELVRSGALWFVPRNPPVTLKDGTTVLGLEATMKDKEGSIFLMTNDQGDTWRRGGFTTGGSQPTLAERADGSLLAMMRQAPRITQIISTDAGKTWSAPAQTRLANPDSGITMTKLANGHFIIVFNNSWLYRTPLSIARSIDEGKTWEEPLALESNPGEYSYPCVIETADGKIHVSYTYRRYSIKHVELNEDWLVHTTRPN